jgi:UDP-glucose 4-epimerase
MKIMITGACGFLGRNLVRFLSDHELILVDLPPDMFDEGVRESWWHNHKLFHVDISKNSNIVREKMRGVDIVIHLANKTRIGPSWIDYRSYYDVNIGASHELFAAAQDMDVKKFIFVSSSSVYGNNNTIRQREIDPLFPSNPYGVSKMAAEIALQVQAQGGLTELIIARPFTMYGDFMDFGENALVIAKFLDAWEKEEPLYIHGDGKQSRDFVHAFDAVQAMKLIIEHGRHGDIFNIGTGESVTVKELADVVSPRQIIVPDRKAPVQRTQADISRLQSLGFRPKVRVIEWLTEQIDERKITELSQ